MFIMNIHINICINHSIDTCYYNKIKIIFDKKEKNVKTRLRFVFNRILNYIDCYLDI